MANQSESRKQKFDEVAEHARHLADHSLEEIDAVLQPQDEAFSTLQERVKSGELTDEDADRLYFNWITYGSSLAMVETVVPPANADNQLNLFSGFNLST